MDYEHDIFISYRQECPTTVWMRNVFLPELRKRLIPRRRDGVNIFDDQQIRVGDTWPNILREKVAASRLLLPMLTPYYFGSKWCRQELALMLAREEKLGFHSMAGRNQGLVLPIRLFDGEKYPDRVKNVQLGDFRDFSDVKRGTRTWFRFKDAIEALAAAIDDTLDGLIPPYDEEWLNLSSDPIEQLLQIPASRQSNPRLTGQAGQDAATFHAGQVAGS